MIAIPAPSKLWGVVTAVKLKRINRFF